MGEASAIEWLIRQGAGVWTPLFHSSDFDLIAQWPDGRLDRIQVKTCTRLMDDRYSVSICTRGGNRSWNGIVKRFDAARCDWLFILVEDGRRWFIPAGAVEGGTAVNVGGPKYAEFEVDSALAL